MDQKPDIYNPPLEPTNIRSVCEYFDLDYREGRTTMADIATALNIDFDPSKDTLASIVSRVPPPCMTEKRIIRAPLVTIVIPCRVGDNLDVLDNIQSQNYPCLEIIVVYDCSREGAAATRNRGAEIARGKYLLFCDADVQLAQNAIISMVSVLENSEAGWVFGRAVIDGRDVTGKRLEQPPEDKQSAKFIWFFNGIHTTSLIRASIKPRFDPRMFRFSDWDLWIQLAKNGHIPVFLDQVVLYSRNKPNNISTGEFGGWYKWQRILFRKHGLGGVE